LNSSRSAARLTLDPSLTRSAVSAGFFIAARYPMRLEVDEAVTTKRAVSGARRASASQLRVAIIGAGATGAELAAEEG
jgi:hypothetical protein